MDKFNKLVEDRFGDTDKFYYECEYLNISQEYFDSLFNQVQKDKNRELLMNEILFNEEDKSILHILYKTPIEELKDLSNNQLKYYPLCSKEEIDRIFNPKNSRDYLLNLRANEVTNQVRCFRVMHKIRKKKSNNWCFENYFNDRFFKDYLSFLPDKERNLCTSVEAGYIHLKEVNGCCTKTPHGNIILISYALRYFLYYMNLWQYAETYNISSKDSSSAFFIAIRTMLGIEYLDFEIDHRGFIPKKIHSKLMNITNWQILFIIGHEYAHHYLNHLANKSVVSLNILSSNNKFYTHSQLQEFDADYYAINQTILSIEAKAELFKGAVYVFLYLNIFDAIREYISPSHSCLPKTHPNPIERIWSLRDRVDDSIGLNRDKIKALIEISENVKCQLICDFLPFHIEDIEETGSIYLPSYKKNIRYDRIDF